MIKKNIYTDAVKDPIGDAPVVDQYDVEYTANFYGSMPDAFMTGSMLRRTVQGTSIEVTVPARGRAFSNFDAPTQPLPTDTTPDSYESIVFPKVADRLQPWSERVSNSYRSTQFFDDKERFYDSCLPNLGEALAADGTQIRTKSVEQTYLPTDFPNLALWCRADTETYKPFTVGFPPSPVDDPVPANVGNRVYIWKDLSGNNRHFTIPFAQASSGPTLSQLSGAPPRLFNEKKFLSWPNGRIPLTSSYAPSTFQSALTIIVVYSVVSNTLADEHVLSDNENFWIGPIFDGVNKGFISFATNTQFFDSYSVTTGSYYFMDNSFDSVIQTIHLTTGHAEHFISGIPDGQSNTLLETSGVAEKIFVGNKLNAINTVGVAEVIIYERKLDRYELARLHSYLYSRYWIYDAVSPSSPSTTLIGATPDKRYLPWNLLLSSSAFSGYSIQPRGNFETDPRGFVLMNCPISGDDKIDDPSTNNSWTWSFPYESRYKPYNRKLFLDDVLGANTATQTMTPGTSSIVTGLDTNPRTLLLSQKINGIVPLLPGKFPQNALPDGARNGYRLRPNDSLKKTQLLPQISGSSQYDEYGYSFLIPSDIYAVKSFESQEYDRDLDTTTQLNQFTTSSMNSRDLTKFYFGFGDLNTMTYYDQTSDHQSVSYEEIFNIRKYNTTPSGSLTGTYLTNVGDYAATLPKFISTTYGTTVDFGPFVAASTYTAGLGDYGWKVTQNNIAGNSENFISSSTSTYDPFAPEGIYWSRNGETGSVSKILRSEQPVQIDPTIPLIPYSSIVFDVTSSHMWKLSYDRAIVQSGSNSPNYFETVLLSAPGFPSKAAIASVNSAPLFTIVNGSHPSAVDALERLEYLTGTNAFQMMEKFTSNPFIPGEYRIAFRYHAVDTTATGSVGRAFLDNIAVSISKQNEVATLSPRTMGATNYPEFRLYSVDDRLNPHSLEDGGQYTNQFYKSNIFGVSPVIRGWKYGLASGFPVHSRAVFRRNKFGQFRDMLEQRPFTKFVYSGVNAFGNAVTPQRGPSRAGREFNQIGQVQESPVTVHFVKRRFEVNKRNIGKIFDEPVNPTMTTSQNLSTEVTSSLPYFDGVARHRIEGSFVSNVITTSQIITVDPNTGEIIV